MGLNKAGFSQANAQVHRKNRRSAAQRNGGWFFRWNALLGCELFSGNAVITLRTVTTRTRTVFGYYCFGIRSGCHTVVSLCTPTTWASPVFRNGRFCTRGWHTHIPLRGVARRTRSIFCYRHNLHRHLYFPNSSANGGAAAPLKPNGQGKRPAAGWRTRASVAQARGRRHDAGVGLNELSGTGLLLN